MEEKEKKRAVNDAIAAERDEMAERAISRGMENGWHTVRAFGWLMGCHELESDACKHAARLRRELDAWCRTE